MSALHPILSNSRPIDDQFVVSYGKSGALGVFTAASPLGLRRGQAVVIQTPRGLEIGSVLCPASLPQSRLLGAVAAGSLLRTLTSDDMSRRDELAHREQQIFETSRAWARRDGLKLEILDAEILFGADLAILQFLGDEPKLEPFAQTLQDYFGLTILLEDLAHADPAEEDDSHGCGKPDCGSSGGGSCSTCSSGGGCSSCGAETVDVREYFSHLRSKMESNQRIPLA